MSSAGFSKIDRHGIKAECMKLFKKKGGTGEICLKPRIVVLEMLSNGVFDLEELARKILLTIDWLDAKAVEKRVSLSFLEELECLRFKNPDE